MVEFFISLAMFILAHVLPEPTGIRTKLINHFGKKAYVAGFSLLSTILLVWLIWSALHTPYINLWQPSQITFLAPIMLMLPACILFTTSIMKYNPLSLAFVQRPAVEHPNITKLLRHPLLWSILLWAASHTIANGDLVGLIMFGGFTVFSFVGMRIFERRAIRTLSQSEYKSAMAKTDGPISLRLKRILNWVMATEVIAGIILYAIVLHLHEPIIGVDPLILFLPQ